MIRARIRADGKLEGALQALSGAPLAAYRGCGERDGRIGHGKRRSRGPRWLAVGPGRDCEPFHSRPDGQPATDPPSGQPNVPANLGHPGPREFPAAYSLAIPRIAVPADGHRDPVRRLKTVRRPPIYPNGAQVISPVAPSPHSAVLTPSIGGFGLSSGDGRKLSNLLEFTVSGRPISPIPGTIADDTGAVCTAEGLAGPPGLSAP